MHLFSLASARKLLLATSAAAFLTLAATPSPAQDDSYAQDDPPAQAGRLSLVSGTVSIQQVGSDDWGQAVPNLPLGPGDRIFTDVDGRAEIQIGQTYIRVGPNSDVSFVADTPHGISIGLAQGVVHLRTFGLWPGQRVYVNTPSGTGSVDSAGEELRVDVLPDEGAAIFTNLGAQAFAGGPGYGSTLYPGQCLELVGSNPVYPQWLQPADWDDLDTWSQRRDQQIIHAASNRYMSPEIPGGDELDANGTWLPGTDYGPIWFPNNVPADWTPYHYGHWVNHDPWGWVWVEDESWGYAPFHYGRWVSFEGRWGWVPGPHDAHPVWSPALVVFAGGIHFGGGAVSAWFPLGPGEPYRPWYHASPRYIDEINRSNIGESRLVHVQTTYVNLNVVNVTYVNRTIAVSAMNHDDFAAGRSARSTAIVVDRRQFDHVQVLDRPEVQPVRQPVAVRPPVRPVPVRAERPVLINENGKLTSAKPGAPPMEPPVKAAPPVRALPGRTVVAAPPAARPSPAPGPAAKPTVNPMVEPMAKPVPPPTARPVAPPVNQPMARPVPPPYTPPAAKPVPPPVEKQFSPPPPPAAKPTPPPAARPFTPPPTPPPARPTPPPAVQPALKPAPPPAAKPQQDKKNDKKDETKPKD